MTEELQKSIEHWQRLVDDPMKCLENDETPYAKNCHLCKKYYGKLGCDGCPVVKKSDRYWCLKTPWFDAERAWRKHIYIGNTEADIASFKQEAQKELDFLKSLV